MQKPDFKAFKKLISAIRAANSGFNSLYAEKAVQEAEIQDLCRQIAGQKAKEELDAYSVEELRMQRQEFVYLRCRRPDIQTLAR